MNFIFLKYPLAYKFYKFFITSGIGWLIDILIVWILVSAVNIAPFFANVVGSTIGILFVFFASLYKIFENNGKYIIIKLIIYIIYSIFLILAMSFMVQFLSDNLAFNKITEYLIIRIVPLPTALIAKIILTPISLILNFFVMKNIIEKIKF
ncbi:MAG: GtrA family protein [Endomicrobium sp.]|jgi:putative flippase GtrA|nr:GtrA family protein [Endomicrobium sp.]